MPDADFQKLLEAMPRIAEAVNGFSSAEIQQQAFVALMEQIGVTVPDAAEGAARAIAPEREKAKRVPKKKPKAETDETSKRSRTSKAAPPALIKDLDLRPDGQQSLRDFVAEKRPKSNHDRNVVSVYYLKQILEESTVTISHVFTAYREMGWRIPADMRNALALTASRKGWVDTADSNDLKLTAMGLNAVEHDMPALDE